MVRDEIMDYQSKGFAGIIKLISKHVLTTDEAMSFIEDWAENEKEFQDLFRQYTLYQSLGSYGFQNLLAMLHVCSLEQLSRFYRTASKLAGKPIPSRG